MEARVFPHDRAGWRFQLPALIARPRWALVYFLLWGPYIAIYQLTNRWPVRDPLVLPFTALDRALPFVPELLPVYVAYIPFYFWTVARSENDRQVNRIFYGTHLQLLVSVPFFVLWPITMPRELFYGPQAYGWADAFWRWFDAPNNCFPSLHVSNCLLLMQFNWQRPHRLAHTAAGVAIIASTVLVKQHYVVDLLGAGGVYLLSRWFLARVDITDLGSHGDRLTRAR